MQNFEYLKVFLQYECDDMPVLFFYEVDLQNERHCKRAIEVFINRKIQTIENLYKNVIEITPIPTVNELNNNMWGENITAFIINKNEFYNVWNKKIYDSKLSNR